MITPPDHITQMIYKHYDDHINDLHDKYHNNDNVYGRKLSASKWFYQFSIKIIMIILTPEISACVNQIIITRVQLQFVDVFKPN